MAERWNIETFNGEICGVFFLRKISLHVDPVDLYLISVLFCDLEMCVDLHYLKTFTSLWSNLFVHLLRDQLLYLVSCRPSEPSALNTHVHSMLQTTLYFMKLSSGLVINIFFALQRPRLAIILGLILIVAIMSILYTI